jgi:hypothetical protein
MPRSSSEGVPGAPVVMSLAAVLPKLPYHKESCRAIFKYCVSTNVRRLRFPCTIDASSLRSLAPNFAPSLWFAESVVDEGRRHQTIHRLDFLPGAVLKKFPSIIAAVESRATEISQTAPSHYATTLATACLNIRSKIIARSSDARKFDTGHFSRDICTRFMNSEVAQSRSEPS